MFARKKLMFIFICIVGILGCEKKEPSVEGNDGGNGKPPPSPYLHTDGRWIKDSRGRTVILRSINVTDRNKRPPFFPEWLDANEYEKLRLWGFNSIRFLIVWEAIEPEPNQYDDAYLDEVEKHVRWAAANEIFVILDMHQDVYSRKFGGDGAPQWAVKDDGIEFTHREPWYANYYEPAVIRAFDNFWKNKDGIQDNFIAAWSWVARRFAESTWVGGYDLFNEPYYGSAKAINDPEFDTQYLQPFYEKLIPAMKLNDPNHLYFFEPNIIKGGGLPCYLGPMGLRNLVYAPHYYDPTVAWVNPYDGNISRHEDAFLLIENEAEKMGVPWWLGEWGILLDTQGAGQYFLDEMKLIEKFGVGSALWAFDREEGQGGMGFQDAHGEPRWVAGVVLRPYPLFTAGELLNFSFDPETRIFKLEFKENNAEGETAIFVPEIQYGDNFRVECSDEDGKWQKRWDEATRLLYLENDPEKAQHEVSIYP